MKIDEFVVEFLLKDKGFNKGADQVENKLSKMAKTAAKVGGALIAAFSSGAVKNALDNATEQVDKLGKTAEKLGIDFQELQELGFVAEQNGIKVDTFNIAIQRMTRRIAEAANTGKGEAVPALQALGLSAEQLNSLTTGDRLNVIADAMSRVSDQGERVRIAFKLFDTEGVDMVRALQNGSEGINRLRQEARDLGIILGDRFAQDGAKYQDTMNRVRRISDALKKKLLFELAPAIEAASTRFVEWWKINGQIITSRLISFFGGVADVISMVIFVIGNLIKDVIWLDQNFHILKIILGILAVRSIPLLIAKFDVLKKALRATGILLLIAALDDLITHFRGGESVTGKFIDKLTEINPILGEVGNALAYVATALGVLAFIPGALAKVWFVIKAIGAGIAAIAAGVSLPFVLIGAAIGAAVALIVMYWDEIKSVAKTAVQAISGSFSSIGESVLNVVITAIQLISGLFTSISEVGEAAAQSIGKRWSAIIDNITQMWRKMVTFIEDIVPDFIKEGVAKVQNFFSGGEAKKVAGTVVTAAAIGTNVAAASPQNMTNPRSANTTTVNQNQYQVDVKIQGDSSGLTTEDVTRGIQKALEDVSVGGLRNTVSSYR